MRIRRISVLPFVASALLMPGTGVTELHATEWQARVGAESPNLGSQAQAFLPSEMWINAGDSIRWTLSATEIHTVTFLTATQLRPANFGMTFGIGIGCPGNTPDGAAFDGSSCVNSGLLGQGPITVGPGLQSYSVTFPSQGNFKLSCLVHQYMQGAIHVLAASAPLPHDQAFYDAEALSQGATLVATTSGLRSLQNSDVDSDGDEDQDDRRPATVTAAIGSLLSSGAGGQQLSLVRFLQPVIVVRVGDTVEWTTHDPGESHTVTFGTEPTDPRPPSTNVSPTSDGALQATISSTTDSVNSGLLANVSQDRPGLSEPPIGVTHFRVTFTAPGTYNYICSLHDNLGMVGTVIVH